MIDPELIAKVLEGKATAQERAAVLTEADRDPELLALLADASAAMGDESAPAVVLPMKKPRVRLGFLAGIAAVLVAAVMLPNFLVERQPVPDITFEVPRGSAAISAARVGAALETKRGAGDEDKLHVSIRIGARLVDYITLADDSARATAGIEIASALRTIPGGSVAATPFEQNRTIDRPEIDAVERVVDVHAFRSAGAGELLRLAANSGHQQFLRVQHLKDLFRYLAADPKLSDAPRAVAGEIMQQLSAPQLDEQQLAKLAERFLAELAR